MSKLRAPSALGEKADIERYKKIYPRHFRTNILDRIVPICVIGGMIGLYVFAFWSFGFSIERILTGIGKIGWIVSLMLPPHPGTYELAIVYLKGLVETLSISLLGTLGAAILAFPFSFLAAKNVVRIPVIHVLARRILDTIRGVDTLIWALIWIGVVGLGPFAGVLAIITADFGAFGKLFSEAIESADRKQGEGILSSGGSSNHVVRFGILPQILPVMASQVLYFFESNTRSATIIGIVGAGGIGLYLTETIRTLEWQQTSFIIILVLVAVSVIDVISSRLRSALIGSRPI